ncbi:hypothetical protein N7539_006842 [Penicillium diatomitis]|uniref:Uncharacterized protein n=1 Tax=Penicillium diatomitis TaxID=2819901 RepID=A0A9W9X1Y8_9EURO|nr:uncharacterized protein N7539_006842 [Penicillium diatomitis]KAJ5480948.1 hypothetical protein N7539_006842 [Penicillium diatomitis]
MGSSASLMGLAPVTSPSGPRGLSESTSPKLMSIKDVHAEKPHRQFNSDGSIQLLPEFCQINIYAPDPTPEAEHMEFPPFEMPQPIWEPVLIPSQLVGKVKTDLASSRSSGYRLVVEKLGPGPEPEPELEPESTAQSSSLSPSGPSSLASALSTVSCSQQQQSLHGPDEQQHGDQPQPEESPTGSNPIPTFAKLVIDPPGPCPGQDVHIRPKVTFPFYDLVTDDEVIVSSVDVEFLETATDQIDRLRILIELLEKWGAAHALRLSTFRVQAQSWRRDRRLWELQMLQEVVSTRNLHMLHPGFTFQSLVAASRFAEQETRNDRRGAVEPWLLVMDEMEWNGLQAHTLRIRKTADTVKKGIYDLLSEDDKLLAKNRVLVKEVRLLEMEKWRASFSRTLSLSIPPFAHHAKKGDIELG